MDSAAFFKAKFKVGLFVVVFAVVCVGSLIVFAVKKGLFETTHRYTLLSRSGEELHTGTPVVFSGFKIGVISELTLNDHGHVLATVKIPDRHAQWVRAASTFTLEKPFIGETKIRLESKNMAIGPPDENQIFEMGVVDDINEVIKRTRPIIDRLERVAVNVENITLETGDLNQSLKAIHTLTAKLAQKPGLLDMAIDDRVAVTAVNQSIKQLPALLDRYENLSAALTELIQDTRQQALGAQGSLTRVNRLLERMLADLQIIDARKANELLTNAAKTSEDVSKSTQDLQVLRQQLDESVARLNQLLQNANALLPGADRDDAGALP